MKTFNTFTITDNSTCNITYNIESTAVWHLEHVWWGSLLVQETCRGEEDCDRLERRASKNTATENGLHNTVSIIHNGYLKPSDNYGICTEPRRHRRHHHYHNHRHYHHIICFTTGPQPLPQRFLHRAWSNAFFQFTVPSRFLKVICSVLKCSSSSSLESFLH